MIATGNPFDVALPIAAAPMAGGPSATSLVEAVSRAGGFGFLAGGYKPPETIAAQIAEVRSSGRSFGVNLFVPSTSRITAAVFRQYAEAIASEGVPFGLDLATATPVSDDDRWHDKIDLLLADPVPVVSFTFGFPDPVVVANLQHAGTKVFLTVTSTAEAVEADARGVDGLVVQSSDAGGHSGTATPEIAPTPLGIVDLVSEIRHATALPLIAAGALASAERVREVIAAGANAAMIGTALLRTDESGATQMYKDALGDPSRERTVVTRAFTGRPARALRNTFTDRYSDLAPLGYPEVNHLTRPLRAAAAAAGDAEFVSLWAGTGYRQASTGPAGGVIVGLARLL